MSKCIFCKREDDGIVCSHCIAENASKANAGIRKLGGFVVLITSAAVMEAIKNIKVKPKI